MNGSVGFHQAWGFKHRAEHARFRHLRVVAADGSILHHDTLADEAALAAFSGDAVRHPNPLPVILDGGKRDRTVWSGDLLVQIPTLFSTTAAEDYVRGSIELLNGYQEATGQSAARVPPVLPPASGPQHGQTYSAVYSMHQLVNLALHHLYTGDLTLSEEQWPWARRMLDWCRTLLDNRGLIVTDENNGLDWDWYDGPKTGAVTAYNAAYHQMLHHAAAVAEALGRPEEADGLRRQADTLRSAVNEHLYDTARHLYRLSDQQPDGVSLDGNSLAVLSGLPPQGEAPKILAALEAVLPGTPYGPSPFSADTGFWPQVSPYVSDMYLRALFTERATYNALDLIRRLWGHMATSDLHAVGTAWELVGTDGSPGFGAKTSLAHGWAAWRHRRPLRPRPGHPPRLSRVRHLVDQPTAGGPHVGTRPGPDPARPHRGVLDPARGRFRPRTDRARRDPRHRDRPTPPRAGTPGDPLPQPARSHGRRRVPGTDAGPRRGSLHHHRRQLPRDGRLTRRTARPRTRARSPAEGRFPPRRPQLPTRSKEPWPTSATTPRQGPSWPQQAPIRPSPSHPSNPRQCDAPSRTWRRT